VKSRFLLDVIIRQSTTVLKLLPSENKSLLVRGDSFLVLDLGLHTIDRVGALNFKGDGFAGEGLHEDLHTTTETEDQVEGGLLLDVVIGEGATILQLLAREDEALLVRGDTFLVLDLGLDTIDGV
jgi:hypothetical protein